jgi:hypothetical protein
MKSYDVVGYAIDGAVYCEHCAGKWTKEERDASGPVFADSEWDGYPVCDECMEMITDVGLTTEGIKIEAGNAIEKVYGREIAESVDDIIDAYEMIGDDDITIVWVGACGPRTFAVASCYDDPMEAIEKIAQYSEGKYPGFFADDRTIEESRFDYMKSFVEQNGIARYGVNGEKEYEMESDPDTWLQESYMQTESGWFTSEVRIMEKEKKGKKI